MVQARVDELAERIRSPSTAPLTSIPINLLAVALPGHAQASWPRTSSPARAVQALLTRAALFRSRHAPTGAGAGRDRFLRRGWAGSAASGASAGRRPHQRGRSGGAALVLPPTTCCTCSRPRLGACCFLNNRRRMPGGAWRASSIRSCRPLFLPWNEDGFVERGTGHHRLDFRGLGRARSSKWTAAGTAGPGQGRRRGIPAAHGRRQPVAGDRSATTSPSPLVKNGPKTVTVRAGKPVHAHRAAPVPAARDERA